MRKENVTIILQFLKIFSDFFAEDCCRQHHCRRSIAERNHQILNLRIAGSCHSAPGQLNSRHKRQPACHIVKHAAQYHQATISLESTLGEGTSISVTFS